MLNRENAKDDNIILNFFDFIELDTGLIFADQGMFVVLSMYDVVGVSDARRAEVSDTCIEFISGILNKVKAKTDNTLVFRIGRSDFLLIKPGGNNDDIYKLFMNLEDELHTSRIGEETTRLELNKRIFEYHRPFVDMVDFIDFLFYNLLRHSNKAASRNLIRNIIGTFTRDMRNMLASCREAKDLALLDEISGLSNNRAGRIYISGLINEYARKQKGFTVMFIDGDNLKRYNQVSYESGNQIIKYLSQIISDSIRDEDKVYRWLSGDEFIVVAKDIGKVEAYHLAERIRRDVEEKTQNCLYPTTVSIGVSHYPSDGGTMDAIISNAEKANRIAKAQGKNRAFIWEAEG